MDFTTFKQHHPLGSRVGDPLLVGHGESEATMFQCVSLIKAYWTECYGIVVNWPGNAIDLWNNTNEVITTKFSRVGGNDAQAGDIVVFFGLNGNPYGHVGIATGGIDGTNVEILEQNGATGGGTGTGGDAIRTRWVSRSRVAGLLRPIQVAAPTPQPAPAAPVQKYTVTENYPNGKLVKLNKDTSLWGMNYDFDHMVANPVEPNHKAGEVWTVTNKVHHSNGYDYYRREGQIDGFNVLDCDDYTPPAPSTPPQGAYIVPSGKTVTLNYDLRGYNSATQAGNLEPTFKQMVPHGTYNIHRYYSDARNDLVNVKNDDGSIWAWVNTNEENVIKAEREKQAAEEAARIAAEEQAKKDAEAAEEAARKKAEADRIIANRGPEAPEVVPVVVEPTPEPKPFESWKDSYKPFFPGTGTGKVTTPVAYQVNLGGRLWNLDEDGPKVSVLVNKGQRVHVYGTVMRDGVKHYRLKLVRDTKFEWWVCAPMQYNGRAVLVKPAPNWLERLLHKGEQLKSIFEDSDPKFIDSLQLNPFLKPKKNKEKK